MNKSIKYLFIAGLCVLTLGWTFFVQKTSSEVQAARANSYELKSNLIEMRWNQIISRDVDFGLKDGPQIFNIELSGLDKTINSSEFDQKYSGLTPAKIKSAYIDAGINSSFFTTQINGETFFVKVQNKKDSIILQGFVYTYVLNLLNAGLSNSEWYFIDSKNSVVFSHNPSYLGKSRSFETSFSKSLSVGNKTYSIQIVDPDPYSSAKVLWFGVLGFLLLGFANLPDFSSSGPIGEAAYSEVSADTDLIVKKAEDSLLNSKLSDKEFVESTKEERGLVERRYKAIDEDVNTPVSISVEDSKGDSFTKNKNLDDVDEFQALELKSGQVTGLGENEGYSEFLTENPTLTMKIPAIPNKEIIESNKDSAITDVNTLNSKEEMIATSGVEEQNVKKENLSDAVLMNEEAATNSADESRSGSDWIKLAEELSANLEKFAGEWKEKEPESNVANKNIETEA